MFLVGSFDGSGAVAGRIRVENPHNKICVLSSRPEPSRADVKTGINVVNKSVIDLWLAAGDVIKTVEDVVFQ